MNMHSLRIGLIVLTLTACALPATARELTPAERLSDFDQLVAAFRTKYGMIEHKKTLGIDLEEVVARYRPRVEAAAGDTAFYDLLSRFGAEFRDGHVSISRPSVRNAVLGFRTLRVEEKAVIGGIDRKVLPESVFPFQVGDELVALDGKPVPGLIQELMQVTGAGTESAHLQKATRMITRRQGRVGPVPTGVVKVDIRRRKAGDVQTVMLPWIVTGATLPGLSFFREPADGASPLHPLAMSRESAWLADDQPRHWMPEGAQPLEGKYLEAAIFDTEKGPMGYLRIPHFAPDDLEKAVAEAREHLRAMRFTKGLVLDVADNPGGSLFYGCALARLFMKKPLIMPTIALRANRTTLLEYRSMNTEAVLDQQLIRQTVELIVDAMAKDRPLTEFGYPYGEHGTPAVAPDDAAYEKPVLLLLNESSVSMGDVFPSIMQDNGRVTVFGKTSAAAGGRVSQNVLAYSGALASITVNILKRPTGQILENNGVKPDVEYDHTQKDVAEGYRAYKAAYTKALLELVR
jgi:hypothetical protein